MMAVAAVAIDVGGGYMIKDMHERHTADPVVTLADGKVQTTLNNGVENVVLVQDPTKGGQIVHKQMGVAPEAALTAGLFGINLLLVAGAGIYNWQHRRRVSQAVREAERGRNQAPTQTMNQWGQANP
jgi:hypothetical protein